MVKRKINRSIKDWYQGDDRVLEKTKKNSSRINNVISHTFDVDFVDILDKYIYMFYDIDDENKIDKLKTKWN